MADSVQGASPAVAEVDFLLTAQLAVAWAGEGGENALSCPQGPAGSEDQGARLSWRDISALGSDLDAIREA